MSTLERLFTYIRANQFSHVSRAAFRLADVYEFIKLISAFVCSAAAGDDGAGAEGAGLPFPT